MMKRMMASVTLLFASAAAYSQWECIVGTPNWNLGGNNWSG